jgi:hypothetical protein
MTIKNNGHSTYIILDSAEKENSEIFSDSKSDGNSSNGSILGVQRNLDNIRFNRTQSLDEEVFKGQSKSASKNF